MGNEDLIQDVSSLPEKSDTSETHSENGGGQEVDNLDNQQDNVVENNQDDPDWDGTGVEPRRSVDRRNKVLFDQNVTLTRDLSELKGRFDQAQSDVARRIDEVQNQSNSKQDPWADFTEEDLSRIAVSRDEEITESQRTKANLELHKRLSRREVNERVAPREDQTAFQTAQAQHWNNVVDELNKDGLSDDPDFNINDKNSEIYRLANDIWTRNASDEAYRTNPRSQASALREAQNKLLMKRLNKASGKEKSDKDRKEKKEQQLESGSTSGGNPPPSNAKKTKQLMERAVASGKWGEVIMDRIGHKIPK